MNGLSQRVVVETGWFRVRGFEGNEGGLVCMEESMCRLVPSPAAAAAAGFD
jgi:hypothetical protein